MTKKHEPIPVGTKYGTCRIIAGPFHKRYGDKQYAMICYRYRCDCGTERDVTIYRLRHKSSRPLTHCGCRSTRHGATYDRNTPEYRLYRLLANIKTRCYNRKAGQYRFYGALGVRVSPEWLNNPTAFIEWGLANGYSPDLTIDRIDTHGHYEPSNCRFVTMEENNRNRARRRLIEAFGDSKILRDWSTDARCVVSYATARTRLRKGWSPEAALSTPPLVKSSGGRQRRKARPERAERTVNSTAKLTAEQVREVFLNRWETQAAAAERLGVRPLTIGNIRRSKTWTNITRELVVS